MAAPTRHYATCWHQDGKSRFVASDDWPRVRARLEDKIEELAPSVSLPEFRRNFALLQHEGNGLPPTRTRPVGFFRVAPPASSSGAGLFVCLLRGQSVYPILAGAGQLDAIQAKHEPDGWRVIAYTPETSDEANAVWEPRPEARRTPEAIRIVQELDRGSVPTRATLAALSAGELIWIGAEARDRERPNLALDAADAALERGRTAAALNLRGGALSDLWSYEMAVAVYEESIAVCESAKVNPWARIGLAATLRRQGDPDQARDHVKLVLRHYRNTDTRAGEYANELLRAIERDMRRLREESRELALSQ